MAHELKLKKGQSSLTISSGRYGLGADFVPPSTNWALNMSGSTSANRLGGSTVISRRAVNTEMAFTVYISGGSTAEVDRGVIDIARMLDMAGDENEPLYLQWRGNSDLPVPVWGQFGAPLSLEIVSGSVMRDDLYGLAGRRADTGRVTVSLVVKPFWLGARQYVLQAEGCVLEDRWPWYSDGYSRGTVIHEATTNKMTNPVFGYDGDPLNGWTATTSVQEANFDSNYILFRHASVKIISNAGTGRITQSIAAGNTNAHMLSCYAKLPDGGVISATQCALYYGTSKTTTYTAVGNGWYRLTAAVTGIAAATATGIQVESGYTVYTDGFQLEEKAYATPLAYGDLPGCAWSGSIHASTTTRAVGKLFLPFDAATNQGWLTSFVLSEFSVSVVWKTSVANTFANNMYFFDNGSIEAYFNATDDKFYFTDGTTTISSAAQTFSAGDTIHLVFVAKPGEIRIYKNGSSIANNTSYDPAQGVMYIGATIAGATPLHGTIKGFTIYASGLTQAQVTAIYNAATPLLTDGDIVDWTPFSISTVVADGTTNQYEDATNKDYLVISGVPGDKPAESMIENNLVGGAYLGLTLNLHAVSEPQRMLNTFKDESGQALGSTLGGEVRRSSAFTTSDTALLTGISLNFPIYNYQKQPLYAALKLADNGTGLSAKLKAGNAEGEWQVLAADSTVRFFIVGPVTMPDIIPYQFNGNYYPNLVSINAYGKRTGSSATVDVDYVRLLFGKVCHVVSSGNYAAITIYGHTAWQGNSEEISQTTLVRGDTIEFEPNKYNYLVIINATIAAAQTYTIDSNTRIWIAPRWSLA